MRFIGFISALFISFNSYSQTLADANYWFDTYEYGMAITSFEGISDKQILSNIDYERWCYAYFLSEDYQNSFRLSDSIVKIKDCTPFFNYVHAYSAFAIHKYDIAETSFKIYQTKDNEYFVDSLLESCKQISLWESQSSVDFKVLSLNGTKADISGNAYENNLMIFQESGIDQNRVTQSDSMLQNAALLFLRPHIFSPDSRDLKKLNISTKYKDYNVSSFAFDNQEHVAYLTMNNPIDSNMFFRYPHIYTAKLVDSTFENIELWNHAGVDDSSATAHATINESSNCMVFAKQRKNELTSDLYYSFKIAGIWEKPQAILSLNTFQDEIYPLFSGDSLLIFASNGRVGYGGLDVYKAAFKDSVFGVAQHFKSPINSSSDDFNFNYFQSSDEAFFTSNRSGGTDDDIYYIRLKEKVEIDTNQKKDNWVDVIIYFDFDKFNLKPSEESKIEIIKRYLEENPDAELVVEGHCDSRGKDAYNMILGQKRAITVSSSIAQLVSNQNQIKILSKGNREPAVICEKKCDESQHRQNRFVKVKLIHL